MIATFGSAETEALWVGDAGRSSGLPPDIRKVALRKLAYLDAAIDLRDLRSPPGNRLEALSGDLAGHHSIRINDQWRIVFRWRGNQPHDVRVIDYHR